MPCDKVGSVSVRGGCLSCVGQRFSPPLCFPSRLLVPPASMPIGSAGPARSALHRRRVTGYCPEIRARRLIGLRPPLLPVPQRAQRYLKAARKFLLRETKRTTQGLCPGHAPDAGK